LVVDEVALLIADFIMIGMKGLTAGWSPFYVCTGFILLMQHPDIQDPAPYFIGKFIINMTIR
jgi:hypothetical protein